MPRRRGVPGLLGRGRLGDDEILCLQLGLGKWQARCPPPPPLLARVVLAESGGWRYHVYIERIREGGGRGNTLKLAIFPPEREQVCARRDANTEVEDWKLQV